MPSLLRIIAGARSSAVVAILTAGLALGIGACGGASTTHHSPASTTFSAFRSCLTKHGLRPGGQFDTLGSRINNPRYTAVQKGCGSPITPRLSAKTITIFHAYTACVAKHGYKLPVPNTSGRGPVFPAGTDRIRRYRRAATDCVAFSRALLRSIYGV